MSSLKDCEGNYKEELILYVVIIDWRFELLPDTRTPILTFYAPF